MLRLVAMLLLLLGALSALTTASAYQVARPSNGMTISVTSYDSARLSISAGANNPYLQWVQGAGTGTMTLDLGRSPGGATGYTFDTTSTYKAYKVFRVTNNAPTAKTITINHGSGAVTVVSGFLDGSATETLGTSFSLAGNGGYVEVNLQISAGTGGGTFTYTITAL